jgi:serine/threonine-protein kinase
MERQIGVYKTLEKIGEGGMGAVYRGLDTMLEREVAIKELRADLAGRSDIVDRFRSEAVTLGKLNHPNIVTLYSFLRQDEGLYMVLEFVRGETLDAMIRRRGALPWPEAVGLVIQALRGLEHAHQTHVIHRDLKPANAIVTPAGVLKLMDFGIARILHTSRLTRVGHLIGTLEYMAPEQVQGREGDARSDLYSIGVVLYELLAGRVPFERGTDYELIKAKIEETAPPLKTFGIVVPPPLAEILSRALATAPDLRFQSAGAFAQALQSVLDQPSAAARDSVAERGRGGRRSSTVRAGQLSRAAWPYIKANPVVAGAVVMTLIGLGLALAPRSEKGAVTGGTGTVTVTDEGQPDRTDSGTRVGSAVESKTPTGPPPQSGAEAPSHAPAEKPATPPSASPAVRPSIKKPVEPPSSSRPAQPIAKNTAEPVPNTPLTPPAAKNPPQSASGSAAQPDTGSRSEPRSSDVVATPSAVSQSFAAPIDRVWTVSQSVLRSLGWDIDKRDRALGYILTESRSLDKNSFGVYEESLRQRLRLHIRATDTEHTVVTVERMLFKRQRVVWVNTDEPVEVDSTVARIQSEQVLAAIAESL